MIELQKQTRTRKCYHCGEVVAKIFGRGISAKIQIVKNWTIGAGGGYICTKCMAKIAEETKGITHPDES